MEFLPLKIDGVKTYAGFWKRFLSGLIDAIIFIPAIFIFNYFIKTSIPVAILITVIQLSLYTIYSIYFNYYYGATIGKSNKII
ncbi:MAG TPA: RDD family protein [Spirochaetota bacterium]|nr:RDD family protein [Spirochaetota bacterium]